MGLFEKFGLVEREEAPAVPEYVPEPAPDTSVEANVQSTENIIGEIYTANGFDEKADSIHTVQALIDTLPAEMTNQKKQATVAGILKVSGKSVQALMNDADERLDLLRSALAKVVSDRTSEIDAAKEHIEQLKEQIELETRAIQNAENIIECAKDSIEDEVKHITELRAFCEGMEMS